MIRVVIWVPDDCEFYLFVCICFNLLMFLYVLQGIKYYLAVGSTRVFKTILLITAFDFIMVDWDRGSR